MSRNQNLANFPKHGGILLLVALRITSNRAPKVQLSMSRANTTNASKAVSLKTQGTSQGTAERQYT